MGWGWVGGGGGIPERESERERGGGGGGGESLSERGREGEEMKERGERKKERKKDRKKVKNIVTHQHVELVGVLHQLHASVVDDHLVVHDVRVLFVDLAAALKSGF